MYNFIKVKKNHFDTVVEFLKESEFKCVGLISNLVENKTFNYPSTYSMVKSFYVLTDQKEDNEFNKSKIIAVFLFLKNKILFHCFKNNFDTNIEKNNISKDFIKWLSSSSIKCIVGTKKESIMLESFLDKGPIRIVNYILMLLPLETKLLEKNINTRATEKYEIRRVNSSDLNSVYPLQAGYEKEEVIPPGSILNKKACIALLEKSIKKQHIYAVFVNNKPVAKAGTNAIGYNWDQLGGIYTDSKWRSQGFARKLVAHVVKKRREEKKNISLFVKPHNEAAIRSYTAVGFEQSIDFRIVYF